MVPGSGGVSHYPVGFSYSSSRGRGVSSSRHNRETRTPSLSPISLLVYTLSGIKEGGTGFFEGGHRCVIETGIRTGWDSEVSPKFYGVSPVSYPGLNFKS